MLQTDFAVSSWFYFYSILIINDLILSTCCIPYPEFYVEF